MMTKFALIMLLVSCGTDPKSAEDLAVDSNSDSLAEQSEQHPAMYSMAVAGEADLPQCLKEQAGRLAYVKESKQFFECSEQGWSGIDLSTLVSGTKGDKGEKGERGSDAKPATDHIFDYDGNDLGTVISSEVSDNGTIKVLLADGNLADLQLSSGKIRFLYGEEVSIFTVPEGNPRTMSKDTIFSTNPFELYKSGSVVELYDWAYSSTYQNGIKTRSATRGPYSNDVNVYTIATWEPAFADYPFKTPLKIKKVED